MGQDNPCFPLKPTERSMIFGRANKIFGDPTNESVHECVLFPWKSTEFIGHRGLAWAMLMVAFLALLIHRYVSRPFAAS